VKLTTHLRLVPRFNNAWMYISTAPYVFIAWCLVEYRLHILHQRCFNVEGIFSQKFRRHTIFYSVQFTSRLRCEQQSDIRFQTNSEIMWSQHETRVHELRLCKLIWVTMIISVKLIIFQRPDGTLRSSGINGPLQYRRSRSIYRINCILSAFLNWAALKGMRRRCVRIH
jgi:hypothetical protein